METKWTPGPWEFKNSGDIKSGLAGAILLGLAFWLVLLAGEMDAADAVRSQRVYCDMVYQWQESRGEFGWPDYRDEAEDCDEH